MGRRPLCLISLFVLIFLHVMDLTGVFHIKGNPLSESEKKYIREQEFSLICGEITDCIRNKKSQTIYLKNTHLLVSEYPSKEYNSNLYPESESILIYGVKTTLKGEQKLFSGQKIWLKGKLQEIESPGNPGEFDEQEYYACKKIYYDLLQTEIAGKPITVSEWKRKLQEFRDKIIETIELCAGDTAPYFYALLLGEKRGLDQETKLKWKQTGILHVLTVSGLHAGILGNGLLAILLKMGTGLFAGSILSLAGLLFYGILAGSGAATLRAVIMFSINIGARILGRSYDIQTSIAIAAILLILECPAWIYSSSFWLSFAAIIGASVTGPVLKEFINSKNHWINMFLYSFSIQITMLPVLLYVYGEISLTGFWLNLLLLPTVALVVISGGCMILTGIFMTKAGFICAIPGRFLFTLYNGITDLILKLPYVTWIPGCPSKGRLVIAVSMWVSILWGISFRNTKKEQIIIHSEVHVSIWKRNSKQWLHLLMLLGVMCLPIPVLVLKQKDCFSITCLDVGQGDGVVIQVPGGSSFLSDFGSSSRKGIGNDILIPYLKHEGVSMIEGIFLSHADEDHTSGIRELLEESEKNLTGIKIKKIFLTDSMKNDPEIKDIIEIAGKMGIKLCILRKGDILEIGETQIEVLSPEPESSFEDENENSLVLEWKYRDFQALFTGDIGEERENRLLQDLEEVDFLKVAHHGSRYSSGEYFLKKIQPKISVISCAKQNHYGHPAPETVERLRIYSENIFFTMRNGAITVSTDGKKISVETYTEE